ncbi:MAG TPA: sulfite exporter TauE/SafE family protein [Micavibrio sp.]
MLIYLPIAEMAVQPHTIILLGVVVGFMSGIFGVGGGFLATPFLMFMGVPPAIAVGTQANQLVSTSLSGVLGHFRTGNVDVKLAGVMIAGSIAGTLAGGMIFKLLQHIGQINLVIPLLYVLLLGVMGVIMLLESGKTLLHQGAARDSILSPLHNMTFFKSLPYKINFPRSQLHISALLPVSIGFLGGFLVAVMGIGGGFILVPLMIYVLGMPTMLVAGTSLLQILATTVIATVMHATTNQSVDIILGVLLIVGGIIGIEFGVRAGRRIHGVYARFLLAVILLAVSYRIGSGLLVEPRDLYEIVAR